MQSIINYILHLADNALIMGHRNSEWCGHGPILEQDIAISNIALDFVGQARNFYQYAAELINQNSSDFDSTSYVLPASEDTLAYLRDERNFKNSLICELPIGDWAQTTLRQFFFSAYQYYYYQQLVSSSDQQLSAIAEKSLKEVTYHLKWSSEWVIRLGDGTADSNARIKTALQNLWSFTGELFEPAIYEIDTASTGISTDLANIKPLWINKISGVFEEAGLAVPDQLKAWHQSGGKTGVHTEHLGYLLAEMQYLQRVYPGCEW